jgi:hypothetical protein
VLLGCQAGRKVLLAVLEAWESSASSGKGRGGVGMSDVSEYDRAIVEAAEAYVTNYEKQGIHTTHTENAIHRAVRAKREAQRPKCDWHVGPESWDCGTTPPACGCGPSADEREFAEVATKILDSEGALDDLIHEFYEQGGESPA